MPESNTHSSEVKNSNRCSSIPSHGGCDQEMHWFPMRVAYNHIKKVARDLQSEGIEYYMPGTKKVEPNVEGYKIIETPLMKDMIFVHSTKEKLIEQKHSGSYVRYLRFITFINHSDLHNDMTPKEVNDVTRITVIPDSDMDIFQMFINNNLDSVTLIPYSETFNHIGRKIRILEGPLAGMICTLRRIKNNKQVHLDCGGFITAQLKYMPKTMYELIDES